MMCVSGNASSILFLNSFNLVCAKTVNLESSGSRSGTSLTTATTPFGWMPFVRRSEKRDLFSIVGNLLAGLCRITTSAGKVILKSKLGFIL